MTGPRIRTSLAGKVGRTPTTSAELDQMAAAAWRTGRGLWLPAGTLETLPEFERLYVEAIGDKIYGGRK